MNNRREVYLPFIFALAALLNPDVQRSVFPKNRGVSAAAGCAYFLFRFLSRLDIMRASGKIVSVQALH
jgi:hypothetical protein